MNSLPKVEKRAAPLVARASGTNDLGAPAPSGEPVVTTGSSRDRSSGGSSALAGVSARGAVPASRQRPPNTNRLHRSSSRPLDWQGDPGIKDAQRPGPIARGARNDSERFSQGAGNEARPVLGFSSTLRTPVLSGSRHASRPRAIASRLPLGPARATRWSLELGPWTTLADPSAAPHGRALASAARGLSARGSACLACPSDTQGREGKETTC